MYLQLSPPPTTITDHNNVTFKQLLTLTRTTLLTSEILMRNSTGSLGGCCVFMKGSSDAALLLITPVDLAKITAISLLGPETTSELRYCLVIVIEVLKKDTFEFQIMRLETYQSLFVASPRYSSGLRMMNRWNCDHQCGTASNRMLLRTTVKRVKSLVAL